MDPQGIRPNTHLEIIISDFHVCNYSTVDDLSHGLEQTWIQSQEGLTFFSLDFQD
jgi:hypothetical protein